MFMPHSIATDFRHRFEQCFRAEVHALPLDSCIDHSGATLPRTFIGPVILACLKSLNYAIHRHGLRNAKHAFVVFAQSRPTHG
jgi:hypothetical protein